MTRMTTVQEDARGALEDDLARLGVAMVLLDDEVQLRINQAIRRDGHLADLLTPALDNLNLVSTALKTAHSRLGQVWTEKEKLGW